MTPFKEKDFPFKETWNLSRESSWTRQNGYSDLVAYIEKIQSAGYDSTRYVVAKYAKISYAFMCLVMVLIASPLR